MNEIRLLMRVWVGDFFIMRNCFIFIIALFQSTFMLILLLLAKGWAVTRQQVTKSGWTLLMSVWVPYCVFHIVLYVWNRVSWSERERVSEREREKRMEENNNLNASRYHRNHIGFAHVSRKPKIDLRTFLYFTPPHRPKWISYRI